MALFFNQGVRTCKTFFIARYCYIKVFLLQVVANGHIVTQGSIDHQIGVLTTITIRVTADMSPQARFIAFYRVNNELVADSAVIEVEEPTTKSG